MNRKYLLEIEVQNGGETIDSNGDEFAIVTFEKDDNTTITISYPEQKVIELTEGQYEVKSFVYSNSKINLEGTTSQKCVDVPRSGILGYFGFEEEKCIDLTIPDQVVSFAVSGGGKQNYYITESELSGFNRIIISTTSFENPKNVEDLQINYNNIEISKLGVDFE